MLPFPSLPWFELARFGRSSFTRVALVAVAVVPLFYGVLYVLANWNPTGNLNRVQAAIVNLDQPVTLTGIDGASRRVSLGRSLSARLTGSGSGANFDWVLTDTAHAATGLAAGRYAAVLSIPANFSAAAASTAGADGTAARQAVLRVRTNDARNYLTGAITRSLAAATTAALNAEVTGTYLDNIYLGFNSLHAQIAKAADGASQEAQGAGTLAGGAAQVDRGADQLATGLDRLRAGTAGLPAQTAQLNAGAQQLARGANQLAGGAARLDAGLAVLHRDTRGLPAQAALLAGGARRLASGLSGSDGVARALVARCRASGASATYCGQISALATQLRPLAAGAGQLGAGAEALRRGTAVLTGAATRLSGGIAQAAGGAAALHSGANDLASGADRLAAGTARLAAAAPQLTAGVASADSGAHQLSSGTGRLADGARRLQTGAVKLADGLRQGLAKIPTYSAAERHTLDQVAATPVVADLARLNPVQNNGAGLAPYFMALALWVGSMAVFMLLRALSARNLASTTPSARVALAAYLPGALMALIQAVLLVAVLHLVVGLQVARLPLLLGFAVLVGLTFAAINQALIATFGGAGRFLALIFVSLQLTTAGGTYPIATAPTFFAALHDYLPMTYAVHGIRACIAGGAGGVPSDALVLLIWAGLALSITILAAHRQRTWTLARLHATAIV